MLSLAPGQNGVDVVLIGFAVVVMPALSVFNGRRMGREPDAPLIPRYGRTMARGWLVVAVLIADWIWSGRSFAALGLDIPPGLGGRLGFLIVAIAATALVIVHLRLRRLLTPERQTRLREQMRNLKILPRSTPELVVFLLVSLTAGIWEELLYRGFFLWFLYPYCGTAVAVLVSSVVFGLGHVYQGWRGAMNAGTLGLVFAIAFVLSGSLWWIIAAHALVDVYGGTIGWRVLRMPPPEPRAV